MEEKAASKAVGPVKGVRRAPASRVRNPVGRRRRTRNGGAPSGALRELTEAGPPDPPAFPASFLLSGIVLRVNPVRLRRIVGAYLVAFLLAVAGAPHKHLNGLEDLLLDEPSDSGTLFKNDSPWEADHEEPAGLRAFDIVQDHPCLACFNTDFVSAPAPRIGFRSVLTPMMVRPGRQVLSAESLPPRDAPSRAPPPTVLA